MGVNFKHRWGPSGHRLKTACSGLPQRVGRHGASRATSGRGPSRCPVLGQLPQRPRNEAHLLAHSGHWGPGSWRVEPAGPAQARSGPAQPLRAARVGGWRPVLQPDCAQLWGRCWGGGGFRPHSWERSAGHLPLSDSGTSAGVPGTCLPERKKDRRKVSDPRSESPRGLRPALRRLIWPLALPWPARGRKRKQEASWPQAGVLEVGGALVSGSETFPFLLPVLVQPNPGAAESGAPWET